MRKPELGEVAHYAEIVAAIAVVASLLYVGRQVEDNTAAIRSATMQAVADSSDVGLQNQVANEEIIRLRFKGNADLSALTEMEAFRYGLLQRGVWIRMQNIYAQQQLGVLDESFWQTYSKIICEIYSPPGVRANWPYQTTVLDADFVKFVESCPG